MFYAQRLKLYQAQNWKAYEKLILSQSTREAKLLKTITNLCCEAVPLERELYDRSLSEYSKDTTSMQALTNAQKQTAVGKKVAMQKEEALKVYCLVNDESTRIMIEAINDGVIDKIKSSKNSKKENDRFVAIRDAKATDKVALETGMDVADYTVALSMHSVAATTEAMKHTNDNWLKVQAARQAKPALPPPKD